MGYSSGGVASLLSGERAIINNLSPKGLSFVSHVNIYTTTIIIFKDSQPNQAPMLFLVGEKDDICLKSRNFSKKAWQNKVGVSHELTPWPNPD
ncbi:hypothetical protein X474_02645 [Dethiosulfatarculus sandiegensis]|uniref:Alpha/beta hydrolase n=1 Tax=Dethiosulfatarculus sandiegensis TaxID=1429043 RepID=A0A0D2JJ58_9BACT|nr:hypothetical protein X474_02645 [Dethiosulfatarculus sandiegensis]